MLDDLGLAFLTAFAAGAIALLVAIAIGTAHGIVSGASDWPSTAARLRGLLREATPARWRPRAANSKPAEANEGTLHVTDLQWPAAPETIRFRRRRDATVAVLCMGLLGGIGIGVIQTLETPPVVVPETPPAERVAVAEIGGNPNLGKDDLAILPSPTPSPTPAATPKPTGAVAAVTAKPTRAPAARSQATPRPTKRPPPPPPPPPTPTPTPTPTGDPPVITFWGARDPNFPGDDADFYGRCYRCNSWTIEFGDGQHVDGSGRISVGYVYGAAGEYVATLTVRGPGGEDSEQTQVRVRFG
jgi:hypothetical protein